MKSYECAIVFYPNLGDEGYKSGTEKYARVIGDQGGELTGLETWGQRQLAYEINHQSEGVYFFYKFRGTNDVLQELGRQLRIDESVLRHLILKDGLAKGDEPTVGTSDLQAVKSGPKEGR